MNPLEKQLQREAKSLAKKTPFLKEIYKELIGGRDFSSLTQAAAVFMAGSPGAGKTEVAKNLSASFSPEPVRIDADDFRARFYGYDGTNSHIFQEAATMVVQKMLDRVLRAAKDGPAIPFILDGTLAYARVESNLKRAIDRGYAVEIYYVYQKPSLAWRFTQARAAEDGRIVPLDAFIKTFRLARENVIRMKKQFGNDVKITVIIKNTDATDSKVYAYVELEHLEKLLGTVYTDSDLRKELELDES